MTRRRQLAASLLLTAALALAVLGQLYFFRRPEYLWDGVAFHGLAAICFLLAWRAATFRPRLSSADPARREPWTTWLSKRPVQTALLGVGLLLALVAALLARDRMAHESTADIVALWLLGITAALVAAFWPLTPSCRSKRAGTTSTSSRARGEPGQSFPSRLWRNALAHLCSVKHDAWLEVSVVAGLTVMALLLRATALDRVPFTLGGDEAWHGLLARQVLRGELRNPFSMGYMSMPTLFYWPISWSLWVVGDNIVGLRMPAVLVGTATIPLFYVFVRRLWGSRTAFLATSFLAAYDYHVHYSRLGANNVWDPAFAILFLWLVDRGSAGHDSPRPEAQQVRTFVLAGLVMGLSTYFYTGARLLPLLLALYLAFLWIRSRLARSHLPQNLGWHLVLLVLAFLVVSAPMLGYALAHPDRWNARLNQVSIFHSGWLAREPGLTGKTTAQILVDQFVRAAGAFHVFPDRTVWYGARRPLLGFLPGLFAALGMAWAVAHCRERRHFLLLLWFWAVIITGGMLTESPPSSQRLVMAIPAVALLVAIGLEQTVFLVHRLVSWANSSSRSSSGRGDAALFAERSLLGRRPLGAGQRGRVNLVLGLLIFVLVVGSVRFYFAEFTPTRRYGSANGETATMIGYYLSDLEGAYQAYFFGAPRMYWGFGTMPFLAPQVPGVDIIDPLEATPDFAGEVRNADQNTVFVFLPERVAELTWVREALPEGRVRESRDSTGAIRFVAYEVQP